MARRRVAGWYAELLADVSDIEVPQGDPDVETSWFVYLVRLRTEFTRGRRDQILGALRDRGTACSDYFTPIHPQPRMPETLGYRDGDFRHTVDRSLTGRGPAFVADWRA